MRSVPYMLKEQERLTTSNRKFLKALNFSQTSGLYLGHASWYCSGKEELSSDAHYNLFPTNSSLDLSSHPSYVLIKALPMKYQVLSTSN